MNIKIPDYPLYDRLRNSTKKNKIPVKKVVEILNSSNHILEHLEIITSLAIHHHLTLNKGSYTDFKDLKQVGKDLVLLNLGPKADQEMVQIICLYFLENYQD